MSHQTWKIALATLGCLSQFAIVSNPSLAQPTVRRGAPVSVDNQTSETTVTGIYSRPIKGRNWGNNRLRGGRLQPGEILDFRMSTGDYEFCVQSANGLSSVYSNINVGPEGENLLVEHEDNDSVYWVASPCSKR